MADMIKMDYALMDEMAAAFNQASNILFDTISEMNGIAQLIADGALVGLGGDAFHDSVVGTLVPAVTRLQEKMLELEGDIKSATETMRGVDSSVAEFVG